MGATGRLVCMVVLTWSCAAFGAWHTRKCYRRGYTWTARWGYDYRATNPFSFWSNLIFYGACSLYFAGAAIYLTLLLPKAFSPACRAALRPLDCL
jgi:hypothetical protein